MISCGCVAIRQRFGDRGNTLTKKGRFFAAFSEFMEYVSRRWKSVSFQCAFKRRLCWLRRQLLNVLYRTSAVLSPSRLGVILNATWNYFNATPSGLKLSV